MPFTPLYDENPIAITPYLTFSFIIFNAIVFLITYNAIELDSFCQNWCAIPSELFGQPQGVIPEWQTLLTSSFLHADWAHLIGNLYIFWIVCDNLENCFGRIRLFLFCIVAAFISSIGQSYVDITSHIPSIGFSGVVSACLGAYFVLYPKAKFVCITPFLFYLRGGNFTFKIPAWLIIPLWFSQDIIGYFSTATSKGGVAFMAHISGFIFGAVIARFLRKYDTDYNVNIQAFPVIRTRAMEILENAPKDRD